MQTKKIYIPLFIGGLVLVITVGAGIFLLSLNRPGNTTLDNKTQNSVPITNSNQMMSGQTMMNNTTTAASAYKNGTYTATGSYFAPSGDESIGVTIALVNGNISTVQIAANAMDPEALRYQERFAQGVSSYVVGKAIDQAYLSGEVNGASLTPEGFNVALDLIKQQAL